MKTLYALEHKCYRYDGLWLIVAMWHTLEEAEADKAYREKWASEGGIFRIVLKDTYGNPVSDHDVYGSPL
jgi:hypothetical protein